MRKLLILLLFPLAANAGYSDKFIEQFNDIGYVQGLIPAVVSIDSVSPVTNGVDIAVSSTLPITAGASVYSVTHNCSSPPSGGGALVKSPSAIKHTSGAVSITGLVPGASHCVSFSHQARGKRSDVQTTAQFTVPSGGGSGNTNEVNWNPGIHLGIKPDQFFVVRGDFRGGWKSAKSVINPMAICDGTATGNRIKGVRVKLEWGEYEQAAGDYSAGDELIDDILQFSESRECGESSDGARDGRRFMLSFLADPKGFGPVDSDGDKYNAIAGGKGGPFDNPLNFVCRQGNGGTAFETCGARIYDPAAPVQAAYTAWGEHIRDRYGSSDLIEMYGLRLEGASSVYNDDPVFGNGAPLQTFVRDFNIMLRDGGKARAWVIVGTNNYRAGNNEQMLTIHVPAMDAHGGMGVSHPDTFDDTPPGQSAHAVYYPVTNGSVNGGPAGQARHAHWAEFQRAGRTFTSIAGVLEQCCDPTYTHPGANLGSYYGTSNPSTTAYGATHGVPITTFGQYPISAWIAELESRPRGWTLFDASCPDAWLAAGLICKDIDGNVIP